MVTHAPKVRVLASHLTQREDIPAFRTGSALCVDIAKNDKRSVAFWLEPSPLTVHENGDTVFK
jgi:phosphohistidine phosphatase SixA